MSWYEKLRARLHDTPHQTPEEDKRLAAAVLLVELARADAEHHPAEIDALRAGLAREFTVPAETVDTLLTRARERAHASISLHEFVQTLNRSMTAGDKSGLFELLWQVAYADGRVDAHEEHLLRKLADLLHVSHKDFIRTKHAAEAKSKI